MSRTSAPSPLGRQWLRVLCTLLNDKNLELRRAATEAAEALYLLVDAALVSSYASYATGPEAVSVPCTVGGRRGRAGPRPEVEGADRIFGGGGRQRWAQRQGSLGSSFSS